ncbi:hypothetical protein DFH06DRAFT_613513 [Mycena polygramma]|nr:hypothetical protein DFH06DRAFT_613513 [Mycena polygramma]
MIALVRRTIYSCVSPSSNGVSPRIADTLSDTLIHRTKRPADDALQGRHCRPMTCPAHAQAAGRRKITIDLRSLFRPRLRVPRLRTVRCPDAEITRPRSLLQLFPRLGYPARRTSSPLHGMPLLRARAPPCAVALALHIQEDTGLWRWPPSWGSGQGTPSLLFARALSESRGQEENRRPSAEGQAEGGGDTPGGARTGDGGEAAR